MSISNEHIEVRAPGAVTHDGTPYFTLDGDKTPVGQLNVFLRLGDSDYLDHLGELHEEPTPDGYGKADFVAWNVTHAELVEYVAALDPDKLYKSAFVAVESRRS